MLGDDYMSNITGYGPQEAKKNIEDFYNVTRSAVYRLNHAYENFFRDLYSDWASPKAVEFNKKYNVTLSEQIQFFSDTIESVVDKAIEAYNTNALANGGALISIDRTPFPETRGIDLSAVNYGGLVGMDVVGVQVDLDHYKASVDEVIKVIDNLPMNIAFYDSDGSQASAYKGAITTARNKVYDEISNLIKDFEGAIENEVKTTKDAASSAASTLQE